MIFGWVNTVICSICIVLGAIFFQNDTTRLICVDGRQWESLDSFGNLFLTLNVVVVIISLTIANQTFYRIPNSFGYFNKDEKTIDIKKVQS